jgi:hypothetical protein
VEEKMPQSPGSVSLPTHAKSERRVWKRFPIYTEVWFQPKIKGESARLSALLLNISRGGLKLVSAHRLEIGTLFRVGRADGSARSTAALSARVVHVASEEGGMWSMGCTFTPKLDEERLQEWVKTEQSDIFPASGR